MQKGLVLLLMVIALSGCSASHTKVSEVSLASSTSDVRGQVNYQQPEHSKTNSTENEPIAPLLNTPGKLISFVDPDGNTVLTPDQLEEARKMWEDVFDSMTFVDEPKDVPSTDFASIITFEGFKVIVLYGVDDPQNNLIIQQDGVNYRYKCNLDKLSKVMVWLDKFDLNEQK